MAAFNQVLLVGNLCRDPEVRYTPKGGAVCSMSLAVNESYTTQGGEKKETVTFVDITVFGKTGENAGKYLSKGSQCLVLGRLRLDEWEDKQTGQKRSKLKVVADKVEFLGSKSGGGDRDGYDQTREQPRRPAPSRPAPSRPAPSRPAQETSSEPPIEDDNIPF